MIYYHVDNLVLSKGSGTYYFSLFFSSIEKAEDETLPVGKKDN